MIDWYLPIADFSAEQEDVALGFCRRTTKHSLCFRQPDYGLSTTP